MVSAEKKRFVVRIAVAMLFVFVILFGFLITGCNVDQSPNAQANDQPQAVDDSDPADRIVQDEKPTVVGSRARNGTQPESLDAEDLAASLWTISNGEDWPEFLGINRDGKSAETGILTDWTSDNLKVVWKVDAGEGYGIGSVANGRFYQLDRHDDAGRLRCIHAETGRIIWQFRYQSNYQDIYGYDSGPRCSPVIDGDRVYVLGVEGHLFCLDAIKGTLIWDVDTSKEFGVVQNFFGVASTPVVHQDTLIVMVGGSPEESQLIPQGQLDRIKPNGSAVVGFDKLTGKIKYKVVDDLASYVSLRTSTIHDSEMAIVWAREKVYGIDPDSGEEHFSFPWRSRKLESVNASMPVVDDNHVFLSECYGPGSVLLKINRSPGGSFEPEVVWSDDARREKSLLTHWNTPVLHDGNLYASSGRHPGEAELRCVDLATGKVHWSQPGLTRCSLTFVDGYLIVMSETGQLFLIRATPEKFDFVTRYDTIHDERIRFRPPCWAAPVVSHGRLYVRGNEQLVCFQLAR